MKRLVSGGDAKEPLEEEPMWPDAQEDQRQHCNWMSL